MLELLELYTIKQSYEEKMSSVLVSAPHTLFTPGIINMTLYRCGVRVREELRSADYIRLGSLFSFG